MKKTINRLALISLLFGLYGLIPLHAQTFSGENEWHYETVCGPGAIPCNVGFYRLKSIGDTIIQGKSCYILQKHSSTPVVNDTEYVEEYVYESNDSIYWYNQENDFFTVLYNINALTGDEWDIHVYDCSFTVTVDSVSYSLYGDEMKKNLFVSDDNNYFTGKIIEGIGHTNAYFPRDIYNICKYGTMIDGQNIESLRCFENDSTFLNLQDITCDSVYTIIPDDIEIIDRENNIQIYPNPASDFLNIEIMSSIPRNQSVYAIILSSKGEVVSYNEITNSKSIVNVSNLSAGVYFVKTIINNQISISKLIIY